MAVLSLHKRFSYPEIPGLHTLLAFPGGITLSSLPSGLPDHPGQSGPSDAPPHRTVHLHEFFYPSNLLTLSRLLILVPTLRCLSRREKKPQALVWVSLAMLTDVVDGPLARARGEVCYLGEVLDPIADKIFLDTVAVALAQTYGFPWWITGLILWRDVGIVTTGLLIYRHREYITPSMDIGKATTVALSTAMILYIADGPRSGKPALYVWLLLGILSVLLYWRRFVVLMRQRNQ